MNDSDAQGERPARDLDDVADREELRRRYAMLLQELRVVLPGVQVLMAFLLTAPFAQRFSDLDDLGRNAYLLALTSAMGSTICLLSPTVFHRVADRTARRTRLIWSIRLAVIGIILLAVALTSALWCITRLVFGTTEANVIAGAAIAVFAIVWVALPVAVGRQRPGAD